MSDTNQRKDFYNRDETLAALGIKEDALKRLKKDGLIEPAVIKFGAYYYRIEDVERIKREQYAEGWGYQEIALRYDVARNSVKRYFRLLNVQPVGYNRALGSVVFDPDTVRTVCHSLGWLENPKDEALAPAVAA